MDIPTTADIQNLSEAGSGPRVTIYMPTHRAGPDTRQDPTRLKNLLTQAEDGLVEQGLRRTIAKDRLKPLADLQADYDFWQTQSDGLAAFLDENGNLRYYRVPINFPEFCLVAPRYHLKPLLPLIAEDTTFYLLAISINETRLLECTEHSQDEVRVEGLPRNMAASLWADNTEKQMQFRSFFAGSSGNVTQFHGAGGTEIDIKDDLLRYFRDVDAALTPYLNQHRRPLLLACVAYLAPIYREASRYSDLIEEPVPGSPDELSAAELQEATWRIVGPIFDRGREEALARFAQLAGTGQTTTDPGEAALAALEGRVDTVFVTLGLQRWGRVDSATHSVQQHEEPQPGDQDLLDIAAANSLVAGAKVYALPEAAAPSDSGIAAIFRY